MDRSGVSVIVAACDADKYVGRAIGSVLAQTVQPAEIIVVDDCSTDCTKLIVEGLKKESLCIRLLSLNENSGPAKVRNLAIDQAKGNWLAIIGADDAWVPDRLERMLAAADRCQVDCVADNQILSISTQIHRFGQSVMSTGL